MSLSLYIYIYTFSFHQKASLMRIEKVYIHLEICNVFENSYVYIFASKNGCKFRGG